MTLGQRAAAPPAAQAAAAADGSVHHGEPDNYLSLKTLAEHSDLSTRTLRAFLHRRVNPLPSYAPGGGKILVRLSEFNEWMAQHRRAASDVRKSADVDSIVDEVLASLTPGRCAKQTP